jgi:thiol:disulfide interchange protein DsbC
MYPILGDDSKAKVDAVWCAKDRDAVWHALMHEARTAPPAKPASCKAPSALVAEMAELLGVRLTPTLFFADGSRMVGLKPTEEIRARLGAGKPLR